MNNSDHDIAPRPSGAYWAHVPIEELGAQVRGRYLEYLRELDQSGHIALWQNIARVYYGYDPGTGSLSKWITETGEQGEFLSLHVNEFASLIRHQLILTTAEKIDFDTIPESDSPEAEAQATLGEQVIRYYQGDGKVDASLVQQAERMILFGAGYTVQLWDAFAGPEVGVEEVPRYSDTGEPVTEKVEVEVPAQLDANAPMSPSGMQEPPATTTQTVERPVMDERVRRGGDITHRVYSPLDVARDVGCRSHAECTWFIVRERWDKYELAARYPEHRATILERPSYDRDETARYERQRMVSSVVTRTDQIHVLRLLHAKTEVMPQGMETLVCGDTVLMPPGPLAYARVPVHVMCSQEYLDTPLGHAAAQDMLGPQSAYNASAINGLTASDAGSQPKWAIARGSNVTGADIAKGFVFYDVQPQAPNAGVPMMIPGPQFTEAHVKGMEVWKGAMQRISGVNSVVRGESEGKSGADNALLSAQATQFMSAFLRAFSDGARSIGLGIIECLQRFANEERMVRIVGEGEAPSVAYFTSSDLRDIRHVEVDLGDPALRTFPMRKQLADEMVERFPNQISPELYMSVISTGRFDPLYKNQRNQIRLIRAENAALAKGEPVSVLISDCHLDHIKEHLAILSSPSLRRDPQLTQGVLQHVQEHEMQWAMLAMRPALLAATAQPPPPPGPMQPSMGGPPPGDGPPPDASGGPPPAERADVPGAPEEMGGVPMPQMPNNAASGEPASMPGGMA